MAFLASNADCIEADARWLVPQLPAPESLKMPKRLDILRLINTRIERPRSSNSFGKKETKASKFNSSELLDESADQ